jgi:hypothetical protein
MKITRNGLFAVLIVLMAASAVIAQTINTHLIFIVPSVVSFRVVLPGSPFGFNNTADAANNTVDIMFNTSANASSAGTTTVIGVNATIRYNEIIGQTDTTGIFNYTNTGNTYLNISIYLDSDLPYNVSGTTTVNNTLRLYAMNRSAVAGSATAPAQPCQAAGSTLGSNNTCIYVNGSVASAPAGSGGGSVILQNFPPGATNSTYLWADFLNVSISTVERNLTSNATGK